MLSILFAPSFYIFQSTRSQRPRPYQKKLCNPDTGISIHEVAKTSTKQGKRRKKWFLYFNPRGRKDLDGRACWPARYCQISIHEVAKTSTANPSKKPIPSPAKSISIIQPPHDYFHQIIISTLYFIHFSPKTGANPPANPWELTVRTN